MAGMSQVIALVDLDDTLFQTRRKCPDGMEEARLTALGFARDGTPLSYATPMQMRLLGWLVESAELIPVTARSRDALTRAHVPHRTAICAHGGMILEEGVPDPEWAARMAKAADAQRERLHDYADALRDAAGQLCQPIAVRVLEEQGTPLYVLAKHDFADADALRSVVTRALPHVPSDWTLHRNGNNAALLPPHLGKQQAVAHLLPRVRARYPDAPVIGIGDSHTDAPFMELCDLAMIPIGSQLAGRLFDAG